MRIFSLLFLIACAVFLTGCFRQSYFLSPSHATSNFYHAKPLSSDSVKSATYIGGAFSAGGANEYLRDELYSFSGYFHRSHNFNRIQAFYGANFSLGSYSINEDQFYNVRGGNKFFSGVGLSGGINLVIPMGTRHEWRVVGIESTIQNEYGNYLSFRKSLPDSTSRAITRNGFFASAGLTTEFTFKLRRSGSIGYKLGFGSALQKTKQYQPDYNDFNYYSPIIPIYLSHTFQLTRNNITGFAQINFGSYAANFQTGINYRLGKIK